MKLLSPLDVSGRTAAGVWGGVVTLMTSDYAYDHMGPACSGHIPSADSQRR